MGFTSIAEGRDPEETRDLLSRYFDLAREVIGRHGGTVEKFIGDAVMAVWGAPIAKEDDAERAVRAAVALLDSVKALGPGIQARAGVATGEAAVTLGATGQGMVAGDLVNTASRLQSVAPPGAVLVGEATERAANRAIEFESMGEQALKGKASPVPAFRAVRIVAEVGGRNRTGGLEAPFVGRDDEFRLLKDLFHATGRDKRPRLVSVMGPAGIGKSRLAWEFSKYADGLVDDTWWHAGRSPSYGEGITFWALGEMIRRRAALLETDDESITRQKIHGSVERWVADPAEQRWVEAALLALLGLGEALPGGRDEMFAAWRTFFERIAEHGTTVLLFEDLQWADSGLLDFIDHLLDWTKALPIFVLTLARPELLEKRPGWGAARRNFVALTLDPLSDADMRELLAGLVPGLPVQVATRIVGRADGIPLYAVETVRMLLNEGSLVEDAGAYRPVGDLSDIAVPETLGALIAARLDGLDSAERSVLQAAAVLGQSFSVAALGALTGTEAEKLTPTLSAFVRRELLALEADPRSPERGQYSFVQALIREVAYNQLARTERKTRHLAAARWFESLGDDELAGVLAEHYAAAHRNASAGPEADALAGQARIALKAAAERAASLGSHKQAVVFLNQALEITTDNAERAALLERAGSEMSDESPEECLPVLDQALTLYRDSGDLHGLARTGTAISIALNGLFRPADAVGILDPLVLQTGPIASEADGVRLLSELARACANARDPRALELADRVLALAEPLELMPVIAEGLINRALALTYQGRFYEPVTILRGLLPILEAHGLAWAEARLLNNLAVNVFSDDVRESEQIIEKALELARRMGAAGLVTYFQGVILYPLLQLGRWDEVERRLGELDEDRAEANLVDALQTKAIFLALRGKHKEAAAVVKRVQLVIANASQPEVGVLQSFIEAQVSLLAGDLVEGYRRATAGLTIDTTVAGLCAEWAARAALWQGDVAGMGTPVRRMEAIFQPGRVVAAARIQMSAGLEALEGRRREALVGYRDAIIRWRELEVPLNLGLCLTDMAIALPSDEPEAAAAADEARQIWTSLGSPPLIARLDEGLARWQSLAAEQQPARVSQAVESSTSA